MLKNSSWSFELQEGYTNNGFLGKINALHSSRYIEIIVKRSGWNENSSPEWFPNGVLRWGCPRCCFLRIHQNISVCFLLFFVATTIDTPSPCMGNSEDATLLKKIQGSRRSHQQPDPRVKVGQMDAWTDDISCWYSCHAEGLEKPKLARSSWRWAEIHLLVNFCLFGFSNDHESCCEQFLALNSSRKCGAVSEKLENWSV